MFRLWWINMIEEQFLWCEIWLIWGECVYSWLLFSFCVWSFVRFLLFMLCFYIFDDCIDLFFLSFWAFVFLWQIILWLYDINGLSSFFDLIKHVFGTDFKLFVHLFNANFFTQRKSNMRFKFNRNKNKIVNDLKVI